MENLKTIRMTRGMSQKQLADMLGVNRTTVTRWETSGRFPRADKLRKISEIFGCPIDFFYRKCEK